jgi:Domain of unknown function (DUF6378)
LKITSAAHKTTEISADHMRAIMDGLPPVTQKERVLDDAKTAVVGDRNKSYGPPVENFKRIADYWNAHLRMTGRSSVIEPLDVPVMMILTKLARLAETPDHRDSIVDLAGYAACYGDVVLTPNS